MLGYYTRYRESHLLCGPALSIRIGCQALGDSELISMVAGGLDNLGFILVRILLPV